MFRTADLVILNKIDLLPHLDFDMNRAAANLRAINPQARMMALSARIGEGMAEWYSWLRQRQAEAREAVFA